MSSKIFSFSAILIFAFLSMAFTSDWAVKKDKNGVKIYTKSVEGYKLKAFKAVMTIKAQPEAILAKLLDASTYTKWQHNCTSGKVVKRIDDNTVYVYSVVNAPWPVSDRDVVTLYEVKRGADGSIIVKMNAKDGITPKVSSNVRITYMKGYWKMIPKNNGQTEVIQEAHAAPGGSIPDWLANSAVVDTPYETMVNLKRLLE